MKLPEKYPNGFVIAAIKGNDTPDMEVIMEGLNFYADKFAELYNSTPDVEGHLIMAAMIAFLRTATEADPLLRPAATALLSNINVVACVCKASKKK